ncbi:gghA [Symbiodinium microadriaticum]|nr:gghA [Symbiodinium microadriaticum]
MAIRIFVALLPLRLPVARTSKLRWLLMTSAPLVEIAAWSSTSRGMKVDYVEAIRDETEVEVKGYSAGCMAQLAGCSRDNCINQKGCSGFNVGGLVVGAALASLLWLPVVCLLGLREPNPGQRAPGAQGAVSFQSKESHLNDRPVIAILASDCGILYNCSSYIPASYVHLLEQGGAQVVPLHPEMPDDEFDHVLSHVNGAMTIGGFFDLNGTAEYHIRKLYDHALELAKGGEVFPLWATCVGIHDVAQMATGVVYGEFLHRTSADNLALPLRFTGVQERELFDESSFPGSAVYRQWLQDAALTFHHHLWGILPETFQRFQALRDSFEIVATAVDRNGQEFIALMQGRHHAIFASAFHPEKPAFEWGLHRTGLLQNTQIPHSRRAILVNLHFGAAFVQQARQNLRKFLPEELSKRLIYNHRVDYTARFPELIRYFEQSYIF